MKGKEGIKLTAMSVDFSHWTKKKKRKKKNKLATWIQEKLLNDNWALAS